MLTPSYVFTVLFSFQNQGRDVFTHSFTSAADASKADMDFSMTSPWSQPISSKMNANYASFPMSANAEVSPRCLLKKYYGHNYC